MYSNDLYKDGEINPIIKQYLTEYEAIQAQINSEIIQEESDDSHKAMIRVTKSLRNYKSLEEIKVKLDDLYQRKEKTWLQIRELDQVLAGTLEVPHLEFETLKKLIADSPKTALLSFYSTNEHTYIFVLRHSQKSDDGISLKLYICENAGYEDLQTLVGNQWLIPYKEDNQTWIQPQQMAQVLQEIAKKLNINDLVNNHLENIEELIIIPHIFLHLIPFAALPVHNSSSSQITYLSDLFQLRIVPSAQILSYCQEREEKNPYPYLEGTKYATVEDASNDLIMASYECEKIVDLLDIPEIQRFKGKEKATVNNYRQLTKNENLRGLHSSHHAGSVLGKPLESALQLGDGRLTLGQLMSPGWRMPHLVEIFLSCCETNLGNPNITDDILTLSAGFLCAGARNVISTLWSVDSLATAFFCLFYYQHRQDKKDRSTALQLAQNDLRNKTARELKAECNKIDGYLRKLGQQPGIEATMKDSIDRNRETIKGITGGNADNKPFESPFYWSGFVCQGLR